MTRIASLLSLLLLFCLSACMTAGDAMEAKRLHGLWKDEDGQFFYLDENGDLGLPRNGSFAGTSWNFDGTAVTLTMEKAPGEAAKQHRLLLQKRGLWSLEFLDERGKTVSWSRSFKNVKRFEGSLFFRERIMLPPEVTISVQLRKSDGSLVGQSMATVSGREELAFRVYYLESDLKEKAAVQVSIFFGREPLFTCPENTTLSLKERPSILLHHAVPSLQKELPLKGTYWRLKELDGKPAESFADQPEAHLILRDKGQATGSDGCNNFFMDWEVGEGRISFSPGGATLRLCPNGEEQAQRFRQMFPAVTKWNISSGQLELRSEDKLEAVFEAVDM